MHILKYFLFCFLLQEGISLFVEVNLHYNLDLHYIEIKYTADNNCKINNLERSFPDLKSWKVLVLDYNTLYWHFFFPSLCTILRKKSASRAYH